MSKTSITIEMLKLLATQKIFKISDLAELLETNPRNIIEYKKELETAGYDILSIPGRYGGYQLSFKPLMPTLRLKDDQKKALDEGLNYLNSRNDFVYKADYIKAMGSIYSALEKDTSFDDITIINRFPLVMDEDAIKSRYTFFSQMIKDMYVAKITYTSTKNKDKTHLIHPYKLFMYNNAWFLIAWNETIHDIGYFKLNRIKSFEKTNYVFEVSQTYKEQTYIDSFGMKSGLDEHHLVLLIKSPYHHIISDRIYGKNQIIEIIDDSSVKLSVTMRHLDQIKAFILGFGPSCEVLEPEHLKQDIKSSIETMHKAYQ